MYITLVSYLKRLTLSFQDAKNLYAQLDPSRIYLAQVVAELLFTHSWRSASLIVDSDYANDGFLDTLRALTVDGGLTLEDVIVASAQESRQSLHVKLARLKDNKSVVTILHVETNFAKLVFQEADDHGLIGRGSVWLCTDTVIQSDSNIIKDYPEGLLAVEIDFNAYNMSALISDAVKIFSGVAQQYVNAPHHYTTTASRYSSSCSTPASPKQVETGQQLYR